MATETKTMRVIKWGVVMIGLTVSLVITGNSIVGCVEGRRDFDRTLDQFKADGEQRRLDHERRYGK